MNKLKAAVLLVAVACGTALAADADAHHGRHHHHRSHVGIWFGIPAPVYYPSYYYPPRYYYPAPVYVPAPTQYIEQPPTAAPPAPAQGAAGSWYFCPDSQTYYPYVQQCASQWQQVAPRAGPPS